MFVNVAIPLWFLPVNGATVDDVRKKHAVLNLSVLMLIYLWFLPVNGATVDDVREKHAVLNLLGVLMLIYLSDFFQLMGPQSMMFVTCNTEPPQCVNVDIPLWFLPVNGATVDDVREKHARQAAGSTDKHSTIHRL